MRDDWNALAAPALRDAWQAGGIKLHVSLAEADDLVPSGTLIIWTPEGVGTAVFSHRESNSLEQTLDIASSVQEIVVEEKWSRGESTA